MFTFNDDKETIKLNVISIIESKTPLSIKKIHFVNEDYTQNKNLIAETSSGNYFIKLYTSGSFEERVFEAKLLNTLNDNECNFTPRIYTDGPLEADGIPIMIFEAIDGESLRPSQLTKEITREVTQNLSYMHTVLNGVHVGEKLRFNPLDFDFTIEFELDKSDKIIALALNILEKAFKDVNESELLRTIIHDDLAPSNVMIDNDGAVWFVDFDDAHPSIRISDIGTTIKEFIIGPTGNVEEKLVQTFVSDYEAVSGTTPLTQTERSLIMPMVLRRSLFMYAYYSQAYRKGRKSLQNNIEYTLIRKLLAYM